MRIEKVTECNGSEEWWAWECLQLRSDSQSSVLTTVQKEYSLIYWFLTKNLQRWQSVLVGFNGKNHVDDIITEPWLLKHHHQCPGKFRYFIMNENHNLHLFNILVHKAYEIYIVTLYASINYYSSFEKCQWNLRK